MPTSQFQGFEQLNRSMLDAYNRFNEIATSRMQQFWQLSNDMAREQLEDGVKHMQSLSGKRPEELLNAQVVFATEASRKAADNAQKYMQLMVDTGQAFGQALQPVAPTSQAKKAA